MSTKHWIGAVVLLFVGYIVGVKYPQWAANIPGLAS
jgi:hypothetical protein